MLILNLSISLKATFWRTVMLFWIYIFSIRHTTRYWWYDTPRNIDGRTHHAILMVRHISQYWWYDTPRNIDGTIHRAILMVRHTTVWCCSKELITQLQKTVERAHFRKPYLHSFSKSARINEPAHLVVSSDHHK